jgi:hypothetical protein
LSSATIWAITTACIAFAAPRIYDFLLGQTADSATRAAEKQASAELRDALMKARDKQIADIVSRQEALDRRVQSLEEWARDRRLR